MSNYEPATGDARVREPFLNVPWPVGALAVALLAAHAARLLLGIDGDRFAMTSEDVTAGRVFPLLTYQFVHGSWAHVLINSAFILAFGAPVARFFGLGARGVTAFAAFFLLCGALAAAGYSAMALAMGLTGPEAPPWALVGASGSASGLMGAAVRLIEGRGRVGPIFGRTVVAMTIGLIGLNVLFGVTGLTPGAGGAPVAWQAHIFGYLGGLLLIGVFGRLAGRHVDHANAI